MNEISEKLDVLRDKLLTIEGGIIIIIMLLGVIILLK
jgi:hypothetical protein